VERCCARQARNARSSLPPSSFNDDNADSYYGHGRARRDSYGNIDIDSNHCDRKKVDDEDDDGDNEEEEIEWQEGGKKKKHNRNKEEKDEVEVLDLSSCGVNFVDDWEESDYLVRLGQFNKRDNSAKITTSFGTEIEASSHRKLHDYQLDGCKWMYELYQEGVGGILGDEMGQFSLL
jgi:DNA excision repair protein ERCC-6